MIVAAGFRLPPAPWPRQHRDGFIVEDFAVHDQPVMAVGW